MSTGTGIVWGRYAKAGVAAAVVVAVGVTLGVFLRSLPQSVLVYAYWVQILGGFLVLWSILGVLGAEIETWGRETAAEKLDRCLFFVLNLLGTFLFAMATGASP
jgi:hypothetical protein